MVFWTKIAQKRHCWSKTRLSEKPHLILHIRISLGIKFYVKLKNFTFSTTFAKKGHFRLKTEKNEQHH